MLDLSTMYHRARLLTLSFRPHNLRDVDSLERTASANGKLREWAMAWSFLSLPSECVSKYTGMSWFTLHRFGRKASENQVTMQASSEP